MSTQRNSAATRLSKAPVDYQIDGIPVGRLACSVNDNEGVVIPIQAYLLENAVRIGDAWRTTEKEAYILNQWYDYLTLKNVGIFNADEGHLRSFLLGGGQRTGTVIPFNNNADVVGSQTNLHKLRVIAGFYEFWQNKRGKKLRKFRGITLAAIKEELLTRSNKSLVKAEISFSRPRNLGLKKRPGTPSAEESEEILTMALQQKDPNRAHTYYLIGCLARHSGSRGVGIAGLLVPNLLKGLKNEPAFKKIDNYRSVIDNHLQPENRRLIVHTLQRMRNDQRNFIYCDVGNKGGSWTTIAIPLELCAELIDYICTSRQELIEARFLKRNKKVPHNVFLSYKNGALSQEAMGNFYNSIFKKLEADGTFHRLRAAFCQEVIRDIYVRERAVNGRAWLVDNVLEFARKLLGHKSVKSLRHYLDQIQAEEVLFGHPIMVDSGNDANYVRAIALQLNSPDGEEFRKALHLFCQQQRLEPIVEEGRRYALF